MATRREFVQGLGAAGVALGGLTACGGGGSKSSSNTPSGPGFNPEPPKAIPSQPILVVLMIEGGHDWLSLLVPNTGTNLSAYNAARPSLKIDPTTGTDDMSGGVGLNRNFYGMLPLHNKGRVAWIPGIGMPGASLSHFTATDLWAQGGVLNSTGWLGRFADTAFSVSGDVLRGIVTTGDVPLMFRGATRSFVSITGSSGFVYPSFLRRSVVNYSGSPYSAGAVQAMENGFGTSVSTATSDTVSQPGYNAASIAGKAFYDAQNNFGVNGQLPSRTPSTLYPGDAGYPGSTAGGGALSGSLSRQFKLIAQMIASGLPGQVYFARIGGFDTHSDQAATLTDLYRSMGGALKSFYDDLASITTSSGNAQDRVMVLGWSEFGRRIQENAGGTDHGTAGLAFCMGNSVKGGFYGAFPNLADPDTNGNMKFTTDYRSLYATVLDRWLGQAGTTTDSLLGASYPRMGFL
jgi:uncharacterized protein (DUF1501 family)